MSDPPSPPSPDNPLADVETVYRMDWHRQYPVRLQRVWEAVSRQDEIGIWMHYKTQLDLYPGGTIHIEFSAHGSLDGVVCELDPLRLLAYTWGDSLVKWELEEASGATHLHLAHIGVRPELAGGVGAGWNAFLDQLEDYLNGNARPSRYREWKKLYEEKWNRPE